MINSLECRIARLFRQKGYYTIVSAGSRGAADVVAIKHNEVLFIQCKRNCGISKVEKRRLLYAALQVGAKPIVAISRNRYLSIMEI
jgi:Holliday junction resolvase